MNNRESEEIFESRILMPTIATILLGGLFYYQGNLAEPYIQPIKELTAFRFYKFEPRFPISAWWNLPIFFYLSFWMELMKKENDFHEDSYAIWFMRLHILLAGVGIVVYNLWPNAVVGVSVSILVAPISIGFRGDQPWAQRFNNIPFIEIFLVLFVSFIEGSLLVGIVVSSTMAMGTYLSYSLLRKFFPEM